MNVCACSFVRAGAVRMCTVLVWSLGMGCVLLTGRGVRPESKACVILRCRHRRLTSSWGSALRVISQPMADPMATSCSTAVTGHVA